MKSCYVVTVCSHLDEENGWPELGATNTIGIFVDHERAREVVCENICDIWETCYHYAFIEKWDLDAVYGCTKDIEFYKFNKDTMKYEFINAPDSYSHFFGFTNIENFKEGRLF